MSAYEFGVPPASASPTFTGTVTEGGAATTGTAISTLTPTSGVAFTPSAVRNTTVYMQLNATVAGTYTLTFGPSTGAEYTVGNAVAMLVGSDDVVTLDVPAGWKVVLTASSVTIGLATIQTT